MPELLTDDTQTTRIAPITDGEREARCVPLSNVEVRKNEDGSTTVEGFAAVYDSESEDLGGFVEELKQGAFRKVLRTKPDVRFLVNHDGVPFGRTTAGTLRLKDTPRGLNFACDFPDTQSARDLAVSIERGDISQCSFMFCVEPEGREWFFPDDQDEPARRVIYEVSALYDVSAVTFPAYPATEIGVRGIIAGEPIASPEGRLDRDLFATVCKRVHGGDLEATRAERRELERAAEKLDTLTPWQRERDGTFRYTREGGYTGPDGERVETGDGGQSRTVSISTDGEVEELAEAFAPGGEGRSDDQVPVLLEPGDHILNRAAVEALSVADADGKETPTPRSVDLMRRRLAMREREFAA